MTNKKNLNCNPMAEFNRPGTHPLIVTEFLSLRMPDV